MISKKRYKELDPRVYEYMDVLLDSLKAEYGEVKNEWLLVLDMLAQNLEVYYIGYDSIKLEGMFTFDKNGTKQRNPGITLMNNAQAYIQKLIGSMGWTLMSKSKIKAPDLADSSDDAFDD